MLYFYCKLRTVALLLLLTFRTPYLLVMYNFSFPFLGSRHLGFTWPVTLSFASPFASLTGTAIVVCICGTDHAALYCSRHHPSCSTITSLYIL